MPKAYELELEIRYQPDNKYNQQDEINLILHHLPELLKLLVCLQDDNKQE